MTTGELLHGLLQTFSQQIQLPTGYEWAPLAAGGCGASLGFLLLIRGAKWAPFFCALAFLGLGSGGGAWLANAIQTPLWPTVGVGAVGGVVLAVTLFRFWQAALLAGCFAAAALMAYAVRLTPNIAEWQERGLAENQLVTLQAPGAVVAQTDSAWTGLSSLWQHLAQTVPQFQLSVATLALATVVAGFALGWFAPRVSRALWATTLGLLLLGMGATALLQSFAPAALEWLIRNDRAAWGLVAGVWLVGLGYNLLTCRRPAKKGAEAPAGDGKPAVA